MRTLSALCLLLASCLFVACSEDTTGGVGTDDVSGTISDGTLGADVTQATDTIGGCMCETGYPCVLGDGGYTCVATNDAVSTDVSGTDVSTSDAQAGNLTCTGVGQCVEDSCSTGASPCGLTCAAGANADVLGKLDALSQCVAAKCQNGLCKGKITTECMNGCTGSQCGTLLLNCFEDNAPGGNPCNSALTCFDACDKAGPKGHFTCMSKCYTGLTLLAKTQLKGFTECIAKTDGGSTAFAQCQDAYNQCATGGAVGTGTCADVDKCIANCPATSGTCQGDCIALGSKVAQGQLSDMNACFGATTDQTKCLGKLETCATPTGTGKCVDVQTCVDACKQGFAGSDDKGSCTIGCLHTTTQAGADAFVALFTCVIPNCPGCVKGDATCNDCLNTQCKAQLTQCVGN